MENKILTDKVYQDAKKTILECIKRSQKMITNISSSPQSPKYDQILKDFEKIRGGNLYYPYLSTGMGHGPFVQLCDGSIKMDCIGGIGVHYAGHSNLDVIEASIDGAVVDVIM